MVDLDRTLTDASLRLVPAALEEVQRVRANGIRTVLATGRQLDEVPGGERTWNAFDVGILEGGGMFFEDGRARPNDAPEAWAGRLERWLRTQRLTFHRGENSFSIRAGDAPRLDRYPGADALQRSPNHDRVDVTPLGVDKGTALAQVLSLNEFHAGECLVFADAQNDLGMFDVADYRVAVGNAEDPVKAVADEVAPGFGGEAVAAFLKTRLSGEHP